MVTEEDKVRFFCRHLIGLGWYEGKTDGNGDFVEQPVFYGASGFLLGEDDTPSAKLHLVTAGHVLTELRRRLSEPGRAGQSYSLFDAWGPLSTCAERIPFDFPAAPAVVEFDKKAGLDYAIISLPDYVSRLFRQTILPFSRRNWVHQPSIEFDAYAVIGLPLEYAEQAFGTEGGREYVQTHQSATFIVLDECATPEGHASTIHPQFVGKIRDGQIIPDIKGMSGGPILGFRRNDKGEMQNWPVAIQSRWLKKQRVVFGTRIDVVASRRKEHGNCSVGE